MSNSAKIIGTVLECDLHQFKDALKTLITQVEVLREDDTTQQVNNLMMVPVGMVTESIMGNNFIKEA